MDMMLDRRRLLTWAAASPLLLGMPRLAAAAAQATTDQELAAILKSAADAVNVFELEAVARTRVPPAHWGYLATGSDGETTLRANEDAFTRYQLKARRFVDVSSIDMSMTLFGQTFASPIVLCPVGSQRAFHEEGELAVARAAAARGNLQILSTQTSTSVENVAQARGKGLWYQLYTTHDFANSEKLVKRAEAAGCPVVVVTVDLPGGRNTETDRQFARVDTRNCSSCHGPGGKNPPKPMYDGLDMENFTLTSPSLKWDFINRLKDVTSMKVVVKGLESGEDAVLAVAAGADGIVVSNHGGRAAETGRGTLECLPEVVSAVQGKIPVLVDGGIRRGTDVFKALALGADAVGIGRPYIWGLGAFGQAGVERVLEMLNEELRLAMVGCGTASIEEITPQALIDTHA
jgi:isopentenyl diphosphate isomerase/L-lactate dehydrogenase-like FMN-dependent dehydrogenase